MAKRGQTVTVSTGVVFRLTHPSLMAVQAVERQMEAARPQPPKVFIEAKGRDEVNDADPRYQAAVQQWTAAVIERQYDTLLATGTAVLSVPDGVCAPDSEDLADLLDGLGIPMASGKTGRYVQWVKFVAAPSAPDMTGLMKPLYALMGVGEQEVAEAVESFRGGAERGADNGAHPVGADTDGDRNGATPAGAGAALRGVGRDGSQPLPAAGVEGA